LYDELVENVTAASDTAGAVTNPWLDIDNAPAVAVGMPVGVPLIDIPAGSWGWVQTWGPCAIHTTAGMTIGLTALYDFGEIGAVQSDSAALQEAIVGIPMNAGVGTYCAVVYLMIAS
jgi:hypothetical protein